MLVSGRPRSPGCVVLPLSCRSSAVVGILMWLAIAAFFVNNWLNQFEEESGSLQHISVVFTDSERRRASADPTVDHPLDSLTSHTTTPANHNTSIDVRAGNVDVPVADNTFSSAREGPAKTTRYVAIIAPVTDVLMTQHVVGARVGNAIASYLSIMAVAHALDRTLVVIDRGDFAQLLQSYWRPLPNVANMSLLSPQPWVLWTSYKDGNCSHHQLPMITESQRWPPTPWPAFPMSCRTNASMLHLRDDLSDPNSPRFVVLDRSVVHAEMWMYPNTIPAWLEPWMPGAYRRTRQRPNNSTVECAVLPKPEYIAATKKYMTENLRGSRVLALHLRLGDALWTKPKFMTPAVVIAAMLNEFCDKHNVDTIYIATFPKPPEYIQLLLSRMRFPTRLLNLTALCQVAPCGNEQLAPMMYDRIVAAHADIAYASMPGASTFADQVSRIRFCLNLSSALDDELEALWLRKRQEYIDAEDRQLPMVTLLAKQLNCSQTDMGHILAAQRAYIGADWANWTLALPTASGSPPAVSAWSIIPTMLAAKCNPEAKPTATYGDLKIGCALASMTPCMQRMAEALIQSSSSEVHGYDRGVTSSAPVDLPATATLPVTSAMWTPVAPSDGKCFAKTTVCVNARGAPRESVGEAIDALGRRWSKFSSRVMFFIVGDALLCQRLWERVDVQCIQDFRATCDHQLTYSATYGFSIDSEKMEPIVHQDPRELGWDRRVKITIVQTAEGNLTWPPPTNFRKHKQLYSYPSYCVQHGSERPFTLWLKSALTVQAYAKRHGMDYIYIDAAFNKTTKYAACWAKVWVLHRLLQSNRVRDGDWLFIIDSDVYFQQPHVHVFDHMASEKVRAADIVGSFWTRTGLGNGEMLLRVTPLLRELMWQWGTSIERGICDPANYKSGNRDQTCLERTFFANQTLLRSVTRARQAVFTDWFVRHCGGWEELHCDRWGEFDRVLERTGLGDDSSLQRAWRELVEKNTVFMDGSMEEEFLVNGSLDRSTL